MKRFLSRGEEIVASLVLLAMVVTPLLPMAARALSSPAFSFADTLLRHLNLWLAFLGALLAAREGKLLRLTLREVLPSGRWERWADLFAATVGAAACALLAWASWDLVRIERESPTPVFSWLPSWVVLLILPVAFAGIGLRIAWRSASWGARAVAYAAFGGGLWFGTHALILEEQSAWPFLLVLIAATLLGAPLFVAIGGSAAILFLTEGITAAAVPSEIYRLASSPFLAALPLFTLAGYLLTLGRTPERLLNVFRSWFGWLPGGMAVVALILCTFFTVFTGGSGVTILALGGLLLPVLIADGYDERFSLGLLTASGSLGLLFPPALPLILYGIAAEVSIEELFLGGLLPGALLVLTLLFFGLRKSRRGRPKETQPFDARAAFAALWHARFELALPVIAIGVIFGGYATVVEAAALTAATALVGQLVFHRKELRIWRDLLPTLRDCVAVMGGVLILLTVAMGLTSWLVDAEVPARLLGLVRENIDSRFTFLLCLNLFLLVVGCFLDIYSATFVVVPLILPLGEAYGIHPIHLGIIFVANLELGYLTPPIGLNLFLASYRFDRSLLSIYRAAWPFLLLLGMGVLVITYMPFLSTAFLRQ